MGTADDLADVVRRAGDRVAGYHADVRDQAALDAAVADAERRWGGLDAAIAAAGVIAGGVPLWEVPAEQEQAVLDIDLGGVLKLARAAIPALLRRPEPRSGRFLAVASAAATSGMPMLAAYCAAKAGVAWPDPGARRRAWRHRRDRERRQPRLHRHARCWPRAPGSTDCRR